MKKITIYTCIDEVTTKHEVSITTKRIYHYIGDKKIRIKRKKNGKDVVASTRILDGVHTLLVFNEKAEEQALEKFEKMMFPKTRLYKELMELKELVTN